MEKIDLEIQQDLIIKAGEASLHGFLHIPAQAHAIVLFAHGSGSSRLSPRNQSVANYLNQEGLATLVFDLLTEQEEAVDFQTRELRFNIPILVERLIEATEWISEYEPTHQLKIGYFGASTGAAAALIAATELKEQVGAVVSRGGRVDLAGSALSKIQAPTLLLVGGNDYGVLELNQHALELMPSPKKLEVVEGATHLFDEPGALEQVCHHASIWFNQYL